MENHKGLAVVRIEPPTTQHASVSSPNPSKRYPVKRSHIRNNTSNDFPSDLSL